MHQHSLQVAYKTDIASDKSIDVTCVQNALAHVLSEEARALGHVVANFPENSHVLVKKILETKGKVIFSGFGKSGIVARKLAATFSGVAIPAIFMHPADGVHGDLGVVQPSDLFIILSKSGTGTEFEYMLPYLKSRGIFSFLITCRHGLLKDLVDETIILPLQHEACSLNLAPTSSTTLMSAFGDSVAVVASQYKAFSKQDFASLHPVGALGRQLLSKVDSFMYASPFWASISINASFQEIIDAITRNKLGIVPVFDQEDNLVGVVTDGDIRRACAMGVQVFEKTAQDFMSVNPKSIQLGQLASVALKIMEEYNITSLLVMDEAKVVGIVHIHDLVKAGIKN